ncbi:hypothetical protein ACRRTK_019289 [Alexandromys fortis]
MQYVACRKHNVETPQKYDNRQLYQTAGGMPGGMPGGFPGGGAPPSGGASSGPTIEEVD